MPLTFDELQNDLARSSNRFNKQLKKLAGRTADRMKNQAIKNAHIYPKKRTGRLISSIQGEAIVIGYDYNIFGYADSDLAPYSEYVEFGTSRMKPRLYVKRAIDKIEPSFRKQAEGLLQKAFKRGY